MSVKTYYRWALLLPLVLPALALPLARVDLLPPGVDVLVMLLTWSLMVGGIPYVLFAAGFLVWMGRVPEDRVRGGILLSPVIYTAVLIACFSALLAVDGGLRSSRDSLQLFGAFGLAFGYAYVGLAELGRALLRPGDTPVPAVATQPA